MGCEFMSIFFFISSTWIGYGSRNRLLNHVFQSYEDCPQSWIQKEKNKYEKTVACLGVGQYI